MNCNCFNIVSRHLYYYCLLYHHYLLFYVIMCIIWMFTIICNLSFLFVIMIICFVLFYVIIHQLLSFIIIHCYSMTSCVDICLFCTIRYLLYKLELYRESEMILQSWLLYMEENQSICFTTSSRPILTTMQYAS